MVRGAPGLFALILLVACGGEDTELQPTLLDLEGHVVDRLTDTPVSEAWVIVDTGDELIHTRTGSDGSFSVPALPLGVPLTLSFAAEDRVAITWQGLDVALLSGPLEVTSLSLQDYERYATGTLEVQGTVSGAPSGSFVLFYGESGYHDYVMAADEPVPFGFTALLFDEAYSFSGVALTGAEYGITAIGMATTQGEDVDLQLSTELRTLTVESTWPELDGEALAGLDPANCMSLGYTHPPDDFSVITGFSTDCTSDEAGASVQITTLPDARRVSLGLMASVEDSTYGWIDLPVGEDDTVAITPLDSPVVEHQSFAPGSTLRWSPVPEATDEYAMVEGPEGPVWYLFAYDGSGTIPFPRLPEGFDTSLLAPSTGAEWSVVSRHAEWVDEGLDPEAPYLQATTWGGAVEVGS